MAGGFGLPPDTPNDYTGAPVNLVPLKPFPRRPLTTDKKFRPGQLAILKKNPSTGSEGELWYLSHFDGSGNAIWQQFSVGSATETSLQTDDGNVVSPMGGIIQVDGIVVSNGANAKPLFTDGSVPSTARIEIQISADRTGAPANTNDAGICSFDDTQFVVDPNGFVQFSGATATVYTAEDSSTATPAANNLNIIGTATNGIDTTAAGNTLTISMASPYSDGDFTFQSPTSGQTRTLTIQNTSNTASSQAEIVSAVAGSSAGDAVYKAIVIGSQTWSWGIDNSDSDSFVISSNASLGTTNVMKIETTGEITKPLQPAFLVEKTSDTANATGDGTVYTINYDSDVFDQGADFSAGTTFTAPVTGKYSFQSSVQFRAIGTQTQGLLSLVTSNRAYRFSMVNPNNCRTGGNELSLSGSCLADMDLGDTAFMTATVAGGTLTVTVGGSAAGTLITFFSGNLTV